MYHAFDSPPQHLIRDVLDRLGTPLLLLRIIPLVMERGSKFLRGAEDVVFRTTHGVKQDCPLSCILFVVVFDIPLRVLDQHGITFSAYVDDICSPAPPRCSQQHSAIVQAALSLIACQLNFVKSQALPMKSPPPPAPVLPKYCHPPCALQASDASLWTALPAPEAPDWSTEVPHSFASVKHLMHLGHPLTAQLRVDTAVSLILRELRAQLNELHSQPIQVIDRILLIKTMVLPRLLYRTECLQLTTDQLYAFTSLLEKFVLTVLGLPSLVAKKTLYTHRSHGLGMGYFPVLHLTRVLDTVQHI